MEPFKLVFSEALIDAFVSCISKQWGAFDGQAFKLAILANLEALEFKDRSNLIADNLHVFLPSDVDERERILLAILHPQGWDNSATESSAQGITGWGTLPMTTLVGQHGLGSFTRSMNALKAMTGHFSSEFAIRFLIQQDPLQSLDVLTGWLRDPDYHIRRLVSEGTRPRLPWAAQLPKFIEDPQLILPLLTALRDDEEEYVRRSVANSLNDIAKDHPDLVANLAIEWMKDVDEKRLDAQREKNRERLVRHACRTLIKQGHSVALSAFGICAPALQQASIRVSTPVVKMGSSLEFDLCVQSSAEHEQKLIIDYVVYFNKANGKTAPKVFKWCKQTLPARGAVQLTRKHAIKPITTRKYYAGEHQISARINGEDFPTESFYLEL